MVINLTGIIILRTFSWCHKSLWRSFIRQICPLSRGVGIIPPSDERNKCANHRFCGNHLHIACHDNIPGCSNLSNCYQQNVCTVCSYESYHISDGMCCVVGSQMCLITTQNVPIKRYKCPKCPGAECTIELQTDTKLICMFST